MIMVRPRTQNNVEGVVLSRFAVIADFDSSVGRVGAQFWRETVAPKKVTSTTDRPR